MEDERVKEKVKTEIVGGRIRSVRDLAVYRKAFDAAMEIFTDAGQEAAETQTWLEFALACNYMEKQAYEQLFNNYEEIFAMLYGMENKVDTFCSS